MTRFPQHDPGDEHVDQLSLDVIHGCPTCDGQGFIEVDHDGVSFDIYCRACQGTGQVNYDPADPTIPY